MADFLLYYGIAVFALRNPVRRVKKYRQRIDPFTFFDDVEFRERYRFTKVTVQWIISQLRHVLNNPINNRGRPITAAQQVLIALRFYATGNFHRDNGDLLHVSQSSSCRAVRKVSRAIAQVLKTRFINFPENDELPNIKRDFMALSGGRLPGVIGAIDCTHVRIKLPGRNEMGRFYNRKQYYSLNVQAIVDAKMRFRNLVCRWPGATHDSRIFQNSIIRQRLVDRERIGHLLGDGGYACTRYLLTPFRNPSTPAERAYNVAQIRARNVVERAFGVLKSRFPCLGKLMRLRLDTTQSVIVACSVLHNIAMLRHEPQFTRVAAGRRVLFGDEPLPDEDNGTRYRQRIVQGHFT